jgi:hypothetical protein
LSRTVAEKILAVVDFSTGLDQRQPPSLTSDVIGCLREIVFQKPLAVLLCLGRFPGELAFYEKIEELAAGLLSVVRCERGFNSQNLELKVVVKFRQGFAPNAVVALWGVGHRRIGYRSQALRSRHPQTIMILTPVSSWFGGAKVSDEAPDRAVLPAGPDCDHACRRGDLAGE